MFNVPSQWARGMTTKYQPHTCDTDKYMREQTDIQTYIHTQSQITLDYICVNYTYMGISHEYMKLLFRHICLLNKHVLLTFIKLLYNFRNISPRRYHTERIYSSQLGIHAHLVRIETLYMLRCAGAFYLTSNMCTS